MKMSLTIFEKVTIIYTWKGPKCTCDVEVKSGKVNICEQKVFMVNVYEKV